MSATIQDAQDTHDFMNIAPPAPPVQVSAPSKDFKNLSYLSSKYSNGVTIRRSNGDIESDWNVASGFQFSDKMGWFIRVVKFEESVRENMHNISSKSVSWSDFTELNL